MPRVRTLPRAHRLRAPLLIALWVLLGVEAVGGLVLFAARVAAGTLPGETIHVAGGLAFTVAWAAYQWGHWRRVRPVRRTLDHAMGLLATCALAATNATGLALGVPWARGLWRHAVAPVPPALSAAHLIGTMLALSFTGAHLGAVLLREPTTAGGGRP